MSPNYKWLPVTWLLLMVASRDLWLQVATSDLAASAYLWLPVASSHSVYKASVVRSILQLYPRSDSESIFQQQFGDIHGDKKSRMTTILLACWCIILRKRAGIDKWIIVCSEENTYLDAYSGNEQA